MEPRNFVRTWVAAAMLLVHLPAAQSHDLWLEKLTLVRRDRIDPAGTGSLAPRHPER